MLAPIEFEVCLPDADIPAHVQSALARGLPELGVRVPRGDALKIIANGPSARNAPLDGPTVALNGALKLFTDAGRAPTYWAAVDPQAMVAGFLTDAPRETTYLVASKCHPSVFDALADRKVIVWHADDPSTWDVVKHKLPVAAVCTVTLTVFEVMHRLGFRTFETWGWDGCYIGGAAHASGQGTSGDFRTIKVGSRRFDTTTNWALEAQAAHRYLNLVPRDVTVVGPGMIGAILNFLGTEGVKCRTFP